MNTKETENKKRVPKGTGYVGGVLERVLVLVVVLNHIPKSTSFDIILFLHSAKMLTCCSNSDIS